MTTPTPRTYTQAEMDRVLDDLNEAIIFQITMKVQHERDLAAAKAELRIEREASNVWQDHLEVAKQDLAAAQEARQAAEERAELLLRLIETVMAIPTMTDEQLAELRRNCRAAIAGEKP